MIDKARGDGDVPDGGGREQGSGKDDRPTDDSSPDEGATDESPTWEGKADEPPADEPPADEPPADEGPIGDKPIPPRTGPWADRVVFGTSPSGVSFAFRPGEVLTNRASEAVEVANEVPANNGRAYVDRDRGRRTRDFRRLLDVNDPIGTVEVLRRQGFMAEVNYVFFAHGGGGGCGCGCGGGCPPHPLAGWQCLGPRSVHPTPYGARSVHPTPFGARSVHPTPFGAQSVHPTPFGAESVHPTPFFLTSVHPTPAGGCGCGCGCGCGGGGAQSVHPTPYGTQSVHPTPYGAQSVHPTPAMSWPLSPTSVHPTPRGGCGCGGTRGWADVAQSVHPTPGRSSARPAASGPTQTKLTALIGTPAPTHGPTVIVLDTGLAARQGTEFPLAMASAPVTAATLNGDDDDVADLFPHDQLLDQVAGHGTFIAGLVHQVAPGCRVVVHKVLASAGDTDEEVIFHRLESLEFADPTHTILNLSFGGYVPELPQLMAAAIARIQKEGVVVVASAGNDGTCEPMFPAALPGVVSVGAVGSDGPAFFSNYGPWVRACAPGVDLVSTFFRFAGAEMAVGSAPDPDNFDGWAIWSGTSFSGPVVAGALARTMMAEGCTAEQAVERVIDNPWLLRLPGLGTVVNVI